MNFKLQEAREKIELQVSQARLKVKEAARKMEVAEKNQVKADENLKYANLGFQEMSSCEYGDICSCTQAMERLDDLSQIFAGFPAYRAPERIADWVRELMASQTFAAAVGGEGETTWTRR